MGSLSDGFSYHVAQVQGRSSFKGERRDSAIGLRSAGRPDEVRQVRRVPEPQQAFHIRHFQALLSTFTMLTVQRASQRVCRTTHHTCPVSELYTECGPPFARGEYIACALAGDAGYGQRVWPIRRGHHRWRCVEAAWDWDTGADVGVRPGWLRRRYQGGSAWSEGAQKVISSLGLY